jgi:hypothetical protein
VATRQGAQEQDMVPGKRENKPLAVALANQMPSIKRTQMMNNAFDEQRLEGMKRHDDYF